VRLVYLGSPATAVPPLRSLHDAGHEIALVVSGPDRRRGRGAATSPTPVKATAMELGLPVTAELDDVLGVEADLGVVVAFGKLLRPHHLHHLRMVNLHFSLLPRWRGAAPVERAILAGDEVTGVCVMDVEEGLDTGGVHASVEVPLDDAVTAAQVLADLAQRGSALLLDVLTRWPSEAHPQSDHGVTYAAKLTVEDRHLDWSRSAEELRRVVRVGGAWTTHGGRRLKVLGVAAPMAADPGPAGPGVLHGASVTCGDGALLPLVLVQPEGRAALAADAWLQGVRPQPGERLGT
jgi:methionyl-tRNA formyltransferase